MTDWSSGRLSICVCLIWSFTTAPFSASRLNVLSSWSLPNADLGKDVKQQEGGGSSEEKPPDKVRARGH